MRSFYTYRIYLFQMSKSKKNKERKKNEDEDYIKSTPGGRLYINSADFFKRQSIIKSIRKLRGSALIQRLERAEQGG